MTLSIRLIRKMILVAMVLIVFSNVAQWVGGSMHKVVATLWGIATAGLAYFCRTKAMKSHTAVLDKRYYLWLMVPVVMTVIPLILQIRRVFTAESQSGWLRLWAVLPVLIDFVLPVGILWVVYAALTPYLPQKEGSVPADTTDDGSVPVERA